MSDVPRHPPRWLPLVAVAVSAALVAAALVAVQATRTATSVSRLQSVLGSLEARFAVSHTWVEELAAGDRNVDVRRDILANQAQAARLCSALVEGGRTPQGRVARLDDARLGDRAGSLCRGITSFRRATARRLVDPSNEPTGPGGRHRDDVLFTAVMADADAVRARLGQVAARERTRRAQALGGALALVAVLLLAAGLRARRRYSASGGDTAAGTELAELRTIKQALVPPAAPDRPGLEIATSHVPVKDGVAGDFHLVLPGPRGTTAIFVGDVAGKGIDAARRGAFLRASLATFVQYERSPRRLLELGNRALLDAAGVSESFVTLLCVVVDPADDSLTWASAGHPPPIDLRTGAPLERRPSLPLGLTGELRLDERTLALPPGDGLLLYTDGLTEARPGDPETPDLLGPERVGRLLRDHVDESLQELAAALRALAERHSGGRLADDLCLVAIRATGVPARVS